MGRTFPLGVHALKFRVETTIDLPRERVIELFDNPKHLPEWMPGLESCQQVKGKPGRPGAQSKLIFDMNGRKVEMVETIVSRHAPDLISGTYEASNVWNRVSNRFYDVGPSRTRWVAENELQFQGPMRIVSLFMRGGFAKQSKKTMDSFKQFAEARSARRQST
jgi:uncharacterized protein YndB with AHSA1/START domain